VEKLYLMVGEMRSDIKNIKEDVTDIKNKVESNTRFKWKISGVYATVMGVCAILYEGIKQYLGSK